MADSETARTVADVMDRLDTVVHPDHPISEALARMRDSGMRILPVADGDEIVGLLRMGDVERDPDASDPNAAVRDEMLAEILYCFADDPVEKAIGVMEQTGFAEYLVVDGEKRLVGHVSLSALKEGKRSARPVDPGSDAELAARSRHGGGRKQGETSRVAADFSTRPIIRD